MWGIAGSGYKIINNLGNLVETKSIKNIYGKQFIIGLIILTFLLLSSFQIRKNDFREGFGIQNLEATYHALLTVTALDESPAKNHWYLPTVSLGRESDKHIKWGMTVPTATGDYIYTSFAPPGFLAPYVWFKVFGLDASVKNLSIFNVILGAVSATILYLLLFDLLKFNEYSNWVSVGGALAGVTIGIFSREALVSHGVLYWCHCLYQPILIASIYLLFKYLTSETTQRQRLYALAMIIAAFVGPMTEWTGYVFNAGLIVLLWMNDKKRQSLKTMVATALAGIVTIVHYGLAVGFGAAASSFMARFLVRSYTHGGISSYILIKGYGNSYGLFLLVIVTIFVYFYREKDKLINGDKRKVTLLILISMCVPLIENLIMVQHASQFSFDRLKFIFPAAMILAFSFARFNSKGKVFLLAAMLVCSLHGYSAYKKDALSRSDWMSINENNKRIASQVMSKVDISCTAIASESPVGGYGILLFHKNIYGYKTKNDLQKIMNDNNSCASVFLESKQVYDDSPSFTKAIITHKNGVVENILVSEK